MAQDPILKKYYEGTIAGGQGPIIGQESSSEAEYPGVYGGEGKKVTLSSDGGTDIKPKGEDKMFDLAGSSYRGPQNWTPDNKGIVNPDTIQK